MGRFDGHEAAMPAVFDDAQAVLVPQKSEAAAAAAQSFEGGNFSAHFSAAIPASLLRSIGKRCWLARSVGK